MPTAVPVGASKLAPTGDWRRASILATPRRQFLEDRAIRAVVAVAVLYQVLQGVAQLGQFADFLVQLFDVLAGQGLDVGAGALAVLPEGQQFADLFQENPKSRERLIKARVCRSSAP